MRIPSWKPGFLAAAAVWILAAGAVHAADPIITNMSSKPWKIIITAATTGKLAIARFGASGAVTLGAQNDAFVLEPKTKYTCQYLDAPNTYLSRKKERMHTMEFLLEGPGGAMQLKSYRSGYADSNVWVGLKERRLFDEQDLRDKISFNDFEPGDITLLPKAEKVPRHF